MRDYKSRIMKRIALWASVCVCVGGAITSSAAEITIEDSQKLSLEFSCNYSDLAMAEEVNDEGQLEITIQDTVEGSYIYMHQNLKSESDIGGVYLSIENPSAHSLLMGVSFNTEEEEVISLDITKNQFYKYETESQYRIFEIVNGMLEIPAGFTGEIYLPYTVFCVSGTEDKVTLDELDTAVGFGLSFSAIDVEEMTFVIDSVAFLNEEDVQMFLGKEEMTIEVESYIPIPVMGESMELCEVVGLEEEVDATYTLEYVGEDVTMSTDGYLTVEKEASNQVATVTALLSNDFILQTTVELDNTWQVYETAVDGTKYYIQSIDDYENLDNISEALALREYVIFFRVLLIGIGIFIAATRIYWKIKKRTSDKGEN